MSNLQTNVPLINVPLSTNDGRANPIWFQFFVQLWRRTGGGQGSSQSDLRLSDIDIDPDAISADLQAAIDDLDETNTALQLVAGDPDVPKLAAALNDISALTQTFPVGDGLMSQQAALVSKIIDLSLILEEAQDVAKKLRKAIDDAVIEGMTPLDPLRSMAYQDASSVKIKGGAIDGTPIGATTQSTGKFTTADLTAGIIRSEATITINALATNVSLPGTQGFSGLLRFRDSTLGGAACFLVDPNGGIQTIVTNQITGLSVSYNSGLGFVIQASLSSGTIPRTLTWSIFGGT